MKTARASTTISGPACGVGVAMVCILASGIHAQQPQTQPLEELPSVTHTQHTNRLIDATSPYLLQHAHNPVDWYPWGEEALARAREEDKPIFLSVGYSACHWCHVMERESFENEEIAAVLNEHFISIKVDREERPDIDEIYMTAVQAMTGSGGWPMSVFLTPDLKPFYGGTYFPPEQRFGRPGFKQVLERLAEVWETRRDEVLESAEKLTVHISSLLTSDVGGGDRIDPSVVSGAVKSILSTFDPQYGGFGEAPKFPSSPSIQLLLREHARTGNEAVLNAATVTLDRMAQGGIYDHLGGGFARYSVDDQWLVPHFEKMLYDNAQLAVAYIEAYQATGKPLYRRVAEETFGYVLRDMRDEGGGFHSAEDADSEGEEGKFYVWSYDEIVDVLGEDDAKILAAYYNLKRGGNFPSHEDYHRGMNVLHVTRSAETVADELGLDIETLNTKLAALREKLLKTRSGRVRPGRDDKVLASWNALMISALARGGQVFDEPEYIEAAAEAAAFIQSKMMRDGELLHSYRSGESRISGFLDDYAYLLVALVDLYEATFELTYLEQAQQLADTMIAEFWDESRPGFYNTSEDHKNLLVRTRTSQDGATPSGASMACLGLMRLGKLIGSEDYFDRAQATLEDNHVYLTKMPRGFLKMVVAADYLVHPPREIAIAGPRQNDATQSLIRTARECYVPNRIVAWYDPASEDAEHIASTIPLLREKTLVAGEPAAYVCMNYACQQPVTTPDALRAQLGYEE